MAEVVTIEKYKSLDGFVYDKLADAERADAQWREENEFNLEKDIARLTKAGEREMKYLRHNESTRKTSRYPLLFVLGSKHEHQYYMANTVEAVQQVYFKILKYNREYGFYCSPAAKAISDEIVRTNNLLAAIGFVKERVDYQYENVYAESITVCEA